jgi:choloylglycine hydrolase
MNEEGLTIEIMWLASSEYPRRDSREEIDNLQWVQYQLDNCATVEEVLATDSRLRVRPVSSAAVHYLVADKRGDCASIDFVAGRMVTRRRGWMPATVLTNDTYESSARSLAEYQGFGGALPVPTGTGSIERFIRVADWVRRYDASESGDPVAYAFGILGDLSMGSYTKWSIVYDIAGSTVHYRTAASRGIKRLPLEKLDFSCSSPVRMIDVNAGRAGDASGRLVVYSPEANRCLVERTFGRTSFLAGFGEDLIERIVGYPEETACSP